MLFRAFNYFRFETTLAMEVCGAISPEKLHRPTGKYLAILYGTARKDTRMAGQIARHDEFIYFQRARKGRLTSKALSIWAFIDYNRSNERKETK